MTFKIQDCLNNALKLGGATLTVAATVLFVDCVYIATLWAMGYTIQIKAVDYRERAQEEATVSPSTDQSQETTGRKRVPSSTPTRSELRVTA